VRTKLISGVIAAFMLLPVAANADEHATDCYLEPTAEVCVPEAPEDEHEVPSDVEEHEDEALVASETALPRTGIETWTILGLGLGMLALGGATLARSSRRRQSDPAAR
jgi:LPXTG-motif cell wall-anchored protein